MSNELKIQPARKLKGDVLLPGDKSISHRALMISSLAEGKSVITGLQEGEDCLSTYKALLEFGVDIQKDEESLIVNGKGPAGFQEPSQVIDCGNSGTTMRLLSGIAAGIPAVTFLTGDQSLRRRPMARVTQPLRQMGAIITSRQGEFPPLAIRGGRLSGESFRLPVASAQVKSCLLLAGLLAKGKTSVSEPHASRDHTERMLRHFGVKVDVSLEEGNAVLVEGQQKLTGQQVHVPGDFSAAAFFLAAAVILPGSEVQLKNVGLNPTRTAFLRVLQKMGGDISIENQSEHNAEPVGDILVRGKGKMTGTTIAGDLIPNLIDEIPLLAVLGLFCQGTTEVRDAAELRVKESDRISAMVTELRKMGAEIEEKKDGFVLNGPQKIKGAAVDSHLDHRIAMSLAIAGLAAEGETRISNPECIAISFPAFEQTLLSLTS